MKKKKDSIITNRMKYIGFLIYSDIKTIISKKYTKKEIDDFFNIYQKEISKVYTPIKL